MTHSNAKIETLTSLIAKITGTAACFSDKEKVLRESDPERLVDILTNAYLQICKIHNKHPTSQIKWLQPAVLEQKKYDALAAKYLD